MILTDHKPGWAPKLNACDVTILYLAEIVNTDPDGLSQ